MHTTPKAASLSAGLLQALGQYSIQKIRIPAKRNHKNQKMPAEAETMSSGSRVTAERNHMLWTPLHA
jgi:hypothetical protein